MAFSLSTKGRAWMATVHIKNMASMGLTEEEYLDPELLSGFLISLWENSGKDRSCAVAVCMSGSGCYHAHMALYGNTTTLKCVSDILFQSHVEPQLGGKKELSSYLRKEGKYAEKDEKVLYMAGMDCIQDAQGNRSDLEEIEELLIKGLTPQEILEKNFRYYKYEKMIMHAYTDQRIRESPVRHDLHVEYHVGESGAGKTYFYEQLCKERGAENIYPLVDYDNNASGGLDSYMKSGAPPILFMDEFKGEGISYGKLLTMLMGYSRMQTHSRYSNTYNLWSTVIITSVYPPEAVYARMVPDNQQDIDSFQQLLRRINEVVFHYKENGEYKVYSMPGTDYKNYSDLRRRAFSQNMENKGFVPMTSAEQLEIPFKED